MILSAPKPGAEYTRVAESSTAEHTLSGLEPGTTTYFVVRAVREGTESENSPDLAVTVR